ncbi:hypothetical protein CDL15_Pgr019135 [Punica granatum]|uniref:Uncharacterized protein n=1 Tax=Punica granatum TaxID=22663 RepID=A0A218XM14_PUNGR|nr:hypothetical protein CDL15_Pgr019135 [Punica granatum]PKI31724.1 hypothetical protein CRG98_047877 [Punica granatum]
MGESENTESELNRALNRALNRGIGPILRFRIQPRLGQSPGLIRAVGRSRAEAQPISPEPGSFVPPLPSFPLSSGSPFSPSLEIACPNPNTSPVRPTLRRSSVKIQPKLRRPSSCSDFRFRSSDFRVSVRDSELHSVRFSSEVPSFSPSFSPRFRVSVLNSDFLCSFKLFRVSVRLSSSVISASQALAFKLSQ